MASDGRDDSRRRHRRSSSPSDEESERISKRHKHRHHRHSHSGKKDEDEIKDPIEDTNSCPSLAPPPSVNAPNSNPDDDLEEGEILEEEGVPSDEVNSAGQSNLRNLGDDAVQEKLNDAEIDSNEKIGKYQYSADGIQKVNFSLEADDSRVKRKERRSSSSKGNDKKKRHKEVGLKESEDSALSGWSRFLSHNTGERSKELQQSPYGRRYRNGNYFEDKADSGEFVRERSWSQSIVIGEDTHPKATHKGVSNSPYAEKSRDDYDSDDHMKTRHSRDHRHDTRDFLRNDGREDSDTIYNATHRGTSDSYYAEKSRDDYDSDDHRKTRHSRDHRHGSRDILRSDGREGSDNYSRYILREDVRNRSRERDIDGEQRREEKEIKKDAEADRNYRKKRERERSMDRACAHERKREERRESSRDIDIDKDRQREKERERRSREKVRDRDRDRSKEKERDRSRDHKRGRYTEREIKDRERSMERKLENTHSDNRNRDRDRDVQTYKTKYESLKDGYRYSDKYRHAKHSGYDERGDPHGKEDVREGYVVNKSRIEDGLSKPKSYEDEQQDMDENVLLELTLDEEEDIEKIKEESRRRRQAIMEKYKNKPQVEKVQQQDVETSPNNSGRGLPTEPMATAKAVPGPSGGRESGDNDQSFFVKKLPEINGSDAHATTGASGLGEGTPKSERSADMFYDDIFGESPTGVRKSGKSGGLQIERSGLHDNWDDAEGYYSYRFGEILDGRYEILAAHGKGVFSTVVRAKDLKAGIGEPQEVAVKILRNKEAMYKAGVEELGILNKLVGADPDDKRHCVRLLSSFKYRNHLCLVFESLSMNLREVLKKFGRNIGLKLTAVRTYAKQLFIALKHLRNCGVLHCDIKPDNMLVNEAKNVLKLCDFGNAMFSGKNELTPYLVSRFYRSPEIILGLPYDHPLDIWSVGCSLYELYTGKVLFPGPSNNDMLRLHMELKGSFPKKMLRKGGFIDQHFDEDLNFLATEEDPVTKKLIKRMILNIKPKDIGNIIKGSPGEDPKMLANFKELLDKIFVLDPDKRMTVQQALSHPFITGK